MSLSNWMDRQPAQFEYLHRVMAYSSLALILIVYYFSYHNANYQIYLSLFIITLLFLLPKISAWIEYKSNKALHSSLFFALDIIIIAIFLSAVHLNLVLTLCALFTLLYRIIHRKISFIIVAVASLFAILLFYLCNIFIFGTDAYFATTSVELTVLAFLCLMSYFAVGELYQVRYMSTVLEQQQHYYLQMHRYIEFSNQLSRYAPSQLWQSIMKGESEAKINYKRKKMTIFFSDIQGFTALSEDLIPDDLAFLLNDYLSHMTEIAQQYEATVDKFMGDAILIFLAIRSHRVLKKMLKLV